jgi:hypothetical protein
MSNYAASDADKAPAGLGLAMAGKRAAELGIGAGALGFFIIQDPIVTFAMSLIDDGENLDSSSDF